jgi:parallel beta-helix repeat protein
VGTGSKPIVPENWYSIQARGRENEGVVSRQHTVSAHIFSHHHPGGYMNSRRILVVAMLCIGGMLASMAFAQPSQKMLRSGPDDRPMVQRTAPEKPAPAVSTRPPAGPRMIPTGHPYATQFTDPGAEGSTIHGWKPVPGIRRTEAVGDPVDYRAAMIAGGNYLRHAQSDITEDNAGNGNPDGDNNDGGWDWVLTSPAFTHSATPSEANMFGIQALGLYYAYQRTPTVAWLTAMTDAANAIIAHPLRRDASALKFLLLYNDLPGITGTAYRDDAKVKYDWRITNQGSGTAAGFAAWLRDQRGVSYPNGIIGWDVGAYAVVAEMLYARFGGTYHTDAVAIAEVLWQDSYNSNPGLFDIVADAGWDPTYGNVNYWWYNLGISGLIDAFRSSGTHTSDIPGLVARLQASQTAEGAICGSYGVHANDEDWQSSAYAVFSLSALNPTAYASTIAHGGYWIAATQDPASGAWKYSDNTHYPEIGAENTMALAQVSGAPMVWVDDGYTSGSCGGHAWGYDAFASIQAGIDGVAPGGTVNVYPGTYSESAVNRTPINIPGVYTFGLFIGQDKNGITVRGVDGSGVPVTNYADIHANVETQATNNFGPDGVYMQGDNVTITGLKIWQNIALGTNKTVTVAGNNFTMKYCHITDVALTDPWASVYMTDDLYNTGTNTSHLQSYTIEGNWLQNCSIDPNNGAGYSGPVSGRKILNNRIELGAWAGSSISFTGSGTPVPWFIYGVGGAVITGNTFLNNPQHIRVRGDYDNAQFDWAAYLAGNTFDRAVVVGVNPPVDVREYSYTGYYGPILHVRRIAGVIQGEINNAVTGDLVRAYAGNYLEDVTVNKAVTLTGAGIDLSVITGLKAGANSATVRMSAAGGIVEGFTITREGNNLADWGTNVKMAGLAIQTIGNATARYNKFTGNRTAIDINNSNGNTIFRNILDFNRSGLLLRNACTGNAVTENVITNNWTVGVLWLAAGTEDATGTIFFNNKIEGNWYTQIENRSLTGGVKNFSGNWLGSSSLSTASTNGSEPGYAVQIPVAYGGTAVAPGGAVSVRGAGIGDMDYTPWLSSNTDTQPGTTGFQGDFSNLWVTRSHGQTGGGPRIQEGITLVTGSTVNVLGGTYTEAVTINKPDLKLLGEGIATTTINPGSSSLDCITLSANGLTVSGFTLTGGRNGVTGTTTGSKLLNLSVSGNSANGIWLLDGGQNILQGNTITGHATASGILLAGSQQNTVAGNTLGGNQTNVKVMINGTRSARGNIIQGNTMVLPGLWSVSVLNEPRTTMVNFNVFGAADRYVYNASASLVLNAQYNWFGGETTPGPGAPDFSGAVDFSHNYATDPTVSVFPSSYYLPTGTTVTLNVMAMLPAGVYARGVDATLQWTRDDLLPDLGDPAEGSFFGGFPSRMYLFDRPTGSSVRVNSAILGPTSGAGNPLGGLPYVGTVFSQEFDAVAEGASVLTLTGIQLRDPNNNAITPVVIDPPGGATLTVDGSAPLVTGTFIDNTTLDNDNFVKNTDGVTLTATVTDGSPLVLTDITADLSGFYGGSGHTADNPASYVGGLATWTVSGVVCSPLNGPITATVSVTDPAGNSATGTDNITADNTVPVAATGLVAKTVSPGGHQNVALSWTAGTDANYRGVVIRYNGWSYPGYPTGSTPVYPSTPLTGTGVAASPLAGTTTTHGIVGRNVNYYSVFAVDWAGNYSVLDPSGTDRAANYYLGDLGSGTGTYIPGSGGYNGQVNYEDLFWFSRLYFSTYPGWTALDPNAAEGDFGPTLGNKTYGANHRFGIARPDGRIDFEDLMIFSMNYNNVAPRLAPPEGTTPATDLAVELHGTTVTMREGNQYAVTVHIANDGRSLKGTSVALRYDPALVVLEAVVPAGIFGVGQQAFFAYSEEPGVIRMDGAMLGTGRTLDYSSDLAVVQFRALQSVMAGVTLETAVMRNGENQDLEPVLRDAVREQPTVFALSQNYPNPFNPATVIEYALPQESHVTLKVYNTLGQEIVTLVDEVQTPGFKSVSWNGKDLASGVYFYRIKAGEFTDLKRMVLMK